ncbi:MAG TPA: UrcA family protein [Caulobacteraceae bacterium]|jgi:UrcA family protein|nr:UrcA family protein [Caulobacteraceae bacterium]
MFKLFTAVAAVAILGAAAPALAGPPVETMSIKVSFSDLDLGHASGARVAYQRISNAADTICGGEPSNHDLQGRHVYLGCMKTVVHDAVARLDTPEVARLETRAPTGLTQVADR